MTGPAASFAEGATWSGMSSVGDLSSRLSLVVVLALACEVAPASVLQIDSGKYRRVATLGCGRQHVPRSPILSSAL